MSGLSQDNIDMRLREAVIPARPAEVMREWRLHILFSLLLTQLPVSRNSDPKA
jgi:hypothetical protein